MTYFFRSRKNVRCNDDLEAATLRTCGTTISLQRLPRYLFGKLLELLRKAALIKVSLRDCFIDARHMNMILQGLVENQRLKELDLDIRENVFDDECVTELTKLILRGIVKSLELPERLRESHCEEILLEILKQDSPVEVLNISGSILTETSLSCLAHLIRNRVVTGHLVMKRCCAPHGTTLTEEHRNKLKDAEKATRRMLGTVKMITIYWFDYVERVDVDIDDLNPHDWEIVPLPPPPSSMPALPEAMGGVGVVVNYMIKHKMEKAWRFVNGRKRRIQHDYTTRKVHIQPADVDQLTNLMGTQKIGDDANPPSTSRPRCCARPTMASDSRQIPPNSPAGVHASTNTEESPQFSPTVPKSHHANYADATSNFAGFQKVSQEKNILPNFPVEGSAPTQTTSTSPPPLSPTAPPQVHVNVNFNPNMNTNLSSPQGPGQVAGERPTNNLGGFPGVQSAFLNAEKAHIHLEGSGVNVAAGGNTVNQNNNNPQGGDTSSNSESGSYRTAL